MVVFLMSAYGLTVQNTDGIYTESDILKMYIDESRDIGYPKVDKTAGLIRMLFYSDDNTTTEGYVWISQHGKKWVQKAYQAQTLRNTTMMTNILNSRCFSRDNMYMSICTYHSKEHKRESDIATISSIVIDVDYTKGVYGKYDCKTAANMLCQAMSDNDIPLPTYVETGRNFKLVYVFQKPFILHKNKTASKYFIKKMGKTLCEKIRNIDNRWCVDDFKLHPFVRIPGSLNRKWADIGTKEQKWVVEEIFEVDIMAPLNGDYNKWNFDELADTVLPELPDWYDSWKAKKKAQKGANKGEDKVTPIRHYLTKESLTESRERDFRAFQSWLDNEDVGYREETLWLYWVNCLHKGMSWDDAREQTVEFNHGFAHPLKDSTVRSECKPTYTGNISDECIRKHLRLDGTEGFFDGVTVTKEEKAEYDKKLNQKKQKEKTGYSTKAEQMEHIKEQIKELLDKGVRDIDIYTGLGMAERTYRRYKDRIKKEQEEQAKKVVNIADRQVIHTSEKEENDKKVIHTSGCQNAHFKCIGVAGCQIPHEVVSPTSTTSTAIPIYEQYPSIFEKIQFVMEQVSGLDVKEARPIIEEQADRIHLHIKTNYYDVDDHIVCEVVLTDDDYHGNTYTQSGDDRTTPYLRILGQIFGLGIGRSPSA